MLMRVPFTDLRSPGDEKALADVCEIVRATQGFVGGAFVEAFEEVWSEYTGARFCVSCASGTDAIELAARALFTIGEVVTVPALTFVGTVEGLERAGLEVWVEDVSDESLLADQWMDVAVPLYRPTAVTGTLIDGAQAHGSPHQGMAETWSFYPSKNLGAWGDAGAVTTNDEGLADEIRSRANHGGTDGWNSRCDAIQCAVLLAKLPFLDDALELRQAAGDRYQQMMMRSNAPIRWLPGSYPWHIFPIRVPSDCRVAVVRSMRDAGVDIRSHYPETVKRWGGRDLPGVCPVAERAVTEILSLPIFPSITVAQQEYVVETLIGALAP